MAAVIDGFAERNHYLRMRQSDYDSKFAQIFENLAKQELLLPHHSLPNMLQSHHEFWNQLDKKGALLARQALEHMLDICRRGISDHAPGRFSGKEQTPFRLKKNKGFLPCILCCAVNTK